MVVYIDSLPTPIGELWLASDGARLVAVKFGAPEQRFFPYLKDRFGGDVTLRGATDPQGFASVLGAYLGGDLAALDSLPVDGGGTPFQQKAWAALREIPVGKTTSYGAIARRIGKPGASRAVGLANGSNPVSLVVPCHRVIGADGSLTGYGGGLERKRWLLEHEGALAPVLF